MKCKYCGEKMTKGIDVCKKCGRDNKPTLSHKILKIFLVVGVIVVTGLISIIVYALTENDLEVEIINEAENEYMAVNVSPHYQFDITLKKNNETANIAVQDIYGSDIKTEISKSGRKLEIKAPEKGYVEGEIYYLDLKDKGKFNDEKLSKAQKLMFVIKRKNSENIEYRDRVKQIDSEDVKFKEEYIIIKGKYKENEIVVTDSNEDGFIEAYKLEDVEIKDNMTRAGYTEPTADELYKKFDIFYYDNVNFSDARIDEDNLGGALEQAGILDAFIDDVYAEGKTNIEAKIEKAGKDKFDLVAVITDKKDSDKKLTVRLGLENKLLIKINKRTVYIDDTFILNNGIEFSVSGENNEIIEKKIKNAMDEYTALKKSESGVSNYEIPLMTIPIPVSAFVPTTLEVGLAAEVLFSAELNAGVDSETMIKQGVIYDLKALETQKKYAEASGNIDAYIMAQGELFAFAGPFAMLEANALYLVKAAAKVKGGGYLDAQGCFTIKDIPGDIKSMGYYDTDLGVMVTADADFEIPFIGNKSIPIAEKRKPLIELSNSTRLKSTDLKDNYVVSDEKLDLGMITATYYDFIEDKAVKKEIKSYSLSIDGKEVDVSEGIVQKKLKDGSYKFRLEWKENGNSYTETKSVNVSEFDPWGFFIENHDILLSKYPEIEAKYGKLFKRNVEDMNYSMWGDFTNAANLAYSANRRERAYYYTESEILFNFTDIDMTCIGISGTAEQIFGINEATDIETLENVMNEGKKFMFGYSQDISYKGWFTWKKTKHGGMSKIYFYNEGAQNVYPSTREWPEDGVITLDNFEQYYTGIGKDYRIVYPTTKVSVVKTSDCML